MDTEIKPKYTDGAWGYSMTPECHVWAAGTPRIAVIPLRDVSINEQVANARLISAATDLRVALGAALNTLRHLDQNVVGDQVAMIERAIAKADGVAEVPAPRGQLSMTRRLNDLRCALLAMVYTYDKKPGDYPGIEYPENFVREEWERRVKLNARAVLRENQ